MKESEYLHSGDPVWWRGAWGVDEPKMAEVEGIETNANTITNNGIPVEKLPWREVRRPVTLNQRNGEEEAPAIVNLTNGHWAMGYQLWPLKIWARTYNEQKMSSAYQVDIVVPYSFIVEAENEQEAEYKAFEEFLNFQGPPDYQTSNAVVHRIEKVGQTEAGVGSDPSLTIDIQA